MLGRTIVKLYTATIDYLATGEGGTQHFLARWAETKEQMQAWVNGEVGSYFGGGADIYEGLPPLSDHVAPFLLSDPLRRLLQGMVDDTAVRGHLAINLKVHVNYS